MKSQHKFITYTFTAMLLMAVGAAGGYWFNPRPVQTDAATESSAATNDGSDENTKVLYWYDPMVPQQHFDKPGKSPFMDMQLVPRYADSDGSGDNAPTSVRIDASVTQNLGMRFAKVTRIDAVAQVDATGVVGFNEREQAVVQTRAAGYVERVWPLAPGDLVQPGQPLAELLVPAWAAAQHEWLAVRTTGDAQLLAAATERLHLLGMPEALIQRLRRRGEVQDRIQIRAPIGGMLQSLDVRNGMTLMAGQTLARINDLASVWLEVAVPETQSRAVHLGGEAEVLLAGAVTQPMHGHVTRILPALNAATRSLRVQVELANPDLSLRPGLSAQVRLRSASGETSLAVPSEAILRTGQRALVMLATGAGRFRPVEVRLGPEIGDQTLVREGLSEGQQVVASGQFLIDSEASLTGITAAFAEKPATPPLHDAEGRIDALTPGHVTLTHGPFQSLNMPGMTMNFALASPAVSAGLQVGDRVRISVQQGDQGLIVQRLEKLAAATEAEQ